MSLVPTLSYNVLYIWLVPLLPFSLACLSNQFIIHTTHGIDAHIRTLKHNIPSRKGARPHIHKHTNAHRIPITHLAHAMLRPSLYIYIIIYIDMKKSNEPLSELSSLASDVCVCVCLLACLFVCVCVRAHSVGTIFATTRGFRQLTRLIPIELHFAYSVFVARPPKKSNLSWCELDLVRSFY